MPTGPVPDIPNRGWHHVSHDERWPMVTTSARNPDLIP